MKGFRKGRVEGQFHKYETAHVALNGLGVNTPRVLDVDAGLDSLTMAFEPGDPLELGLESMELFHVIGESLAEFQDTPTDAKLESFGSRDELAVIKKFSQRLRRMEQAQPPGFADISMRLQNAEKKLPPANIGLCHRDLHDKQFIRHRKYITLLDFDLLCIADKTLDTANLLAHLTLRNFQNTRDSTQKSVERCGRRLLQGLDRNRESGFWERLRFYQASTFCRLALVYSMRPAWTGLAGDLVGMGKRCLDDFERVQQN